MPQEEAFRYHVDGLAMVVKIVFLGLEKWKDLMLGGEEINGRHVQPESHSNGSFVCLQVKIFFDGIIALLEREIFD